LKKLIILRILCINASLSPIYAFFDITSGTVFSFFPAIAQKKEPSAMERSLLFMIGIA